MGYSITMHSQTSHWVTQLTLSHGVFVDRDHGLVTPHVNEYLNAPYISCPMPVTSIQACRAGLVLLMSLIPSYWAAVHEVTHLLLLVLPEFPSMGLFLHLIPLWDGTFA